MRNCISTEDVQYCLLYSSITRRPVNNVLKDKRFSEEYYVTVATKTITEFNLVQSCQA